MTFSPSPPVATFVSFLLEVESTFEVHDYVKSYLGETRDAHNFAKQFLERRQKLKPPSQQKVIGILIQYMYCETLLNRHPSVVDSSQ